MPSWVTTTMRPGSFSSSGWLPWWALLLGHPDSLSHANGGGLSTPAVQRPPQGQGGADGATRAATDFIIGTPGADRDSPSGWSRAESLRHTRVFRGSSDP